MPGTTRYSATFDRTYEENLPAEPPVTRRSRSQSLQAESFGGLTRQHGPLFSFQGSHSRSSSTENGNHGAIKTTDGIPTRTAATPSVKPHNNPFQFVKVGTCPLYKKAEEQLKKAQEVKKTPTVKEEEEEWQSNLDSWKSRRRKMSESTFRRQEELRSFENVEQPENGHSQRRIKTFSEMVEERAHRGRAVSLCLFSNPLESSEWMFENKNGPGRKMSHDPLQLSGESAESSNINSEDDNDNYEKQEAEQQLEQIVNRVSNGLNNNQNGIHTSTSNSSISKNSDLSELDVSQGSASHKERNSSSGGYIDSGLESLSSSQRVSELPDSGSDFSQDSSGSNSIADCDSPRVSGLITTGIDLLGEFSSNEELLKCHVISQIEKSPTVVLNGHMTNGKSSIRSMEASEVGQNKRKIDSNASVKKASAKLVTQNSMPRNTKGEAKENKPISGVNGTVVQKERSVESDNEMFVDDFSEMNLAREAKLGNFSTENEYEDLLTGDSMNIVYKSDLNSSSVKVLGKYVPKESSQSGIGNTFSLISEVPVEKVTEEMERLILEQLEQEEREKEISKLKDAAASNDSPVKSVEPPKEKPPPPPPESPPKTTAQKSTSVKRVNSTKRILKEIHKRRSDFLGIESNEADVSICDEMSMPPPSAALDDLLKVKREEEEMITRKILANSAASCSSFDEDEIARKEREIIENLENEERLKSSQNCGSLMPSVPANDAEVKLEEEGEEERIKRLKEERKRIEEERFQEEEEKLQLEETKLLRQREQEIRKQEAGGGDVIIPVLVNSSEISCANSNKITTDSVACHEHNAGSGGGESEQNRSSSSSFSQTEIPKMEEAPPSSTPKPLKKKEALRKDRERLRHEQEILQREREELRRKVQLEQDQLKKVLQKAHVDPPVCRVGPPTPAKPTLLTQLTTSSHMPRREAPGQVHPVHSQNGIGAVTTGQQPPFKPKGRQSQGLVSPSRSTAELRTKQKVSSVRKQAESGESRYNQNHWLIQEAEMRRIAEQKERQYNQSQVDVVRSINQARYSDGYSTGPNKPIQKPNILPIAQNVNSKSVNYAVPMQYSPEKLRNFDPQLCQNGLNRKCVAQPTAFDPNQTGLIYSSNHDLGMSPPAKPSRVLPLEKPEQMLSVSGRKRCSHCGEELGRGAAMIIESLQLYYHIQCFQCCVCHAQLGNGSCGTDVRVRNNKLHCHNCYSNDEAGLKFSQV